MKPTICFIGAGNLATHLSRKFQQEGYKILQVYSRTTESAELLAKSLDAQFTSEVKEITGKADMYFVVLKDSATSEVLSQIDFRNKLLVHCSGSLPLTILSSHSKNNGVLYPLQTFQKVGKLNLTPYRYLLRQILS